MLEIHFTFVLTVITFLFTLAVLYLFLKNPKNIDFWYNFLFFLSSTIVLFGICSIEVNTVPRLAPFWTKLCYAGLTGYIYAFPFFVTAITDWEIPKPLRSALPAASLFLIFLILFTDAIVVNRPAPYARYLQAERGVFHPLYTTIIIGTVVYAYIQLIRHGRKTSGFAFDYRPVYIGTALAIALGSVDLAGALMRRPMLSFLPHPSIIAIFIAVVSFAWTFLSQYSWILQSLTRTEHEVRLLIDKSNKNFIEFVQLIAKTLDAKDHYTAGHSLRVMDYAVKIARCLKVPETDVELLKRACLLHDIGKICIPDGILNKKSPLSDHEREHIIKHPIVGRQILSTVSDFQTILDIIYAHHERVDGQGYPKGLSREEIPLLARIIAVADTYDAICSERPYRKAKNREQAIQELKKVSGTQLDERIVAAFVSLGES
jgi:putative nucleotidyltransferase with HDIG domain